MAVDYATLYGDMAGGFTPIKDCSKLPVYRLCLAQCAVAGDPCASHRAGALGRAAT